MHRLSCCSVARGILLDRGSTLCLLHWQADSLPLSHQRKPWAFSFPRGHRAQVISRSQLFYDMNSNKINTCSLFKKNNHFLLFIDFLCPSLYDDQKQWKKETWREKKLEERNNWDSRLAHKDPWRRKWLPTPVFLPEKSHRQTSWQAIVQRVRHDLMTKQQQIGFCWILMVFINKDGLRILP